MIELFLSHQNRFPIKISTLSSLNQDLLPVSGPLCIDADGTAASKFNELIATCSELIPLVFF